MNILGVHAEKPELPRRRRAGNSDIPQLRPGRDVDTLSCPGRDTFHRSGLVPVFDLSAVPVHAQGGSFALWVAVFLPGLGLAAYIIALTVWSRPAGHDP